MRRSQFWLTALLMVVLDILVASTLGGYNTYTRDFDFGRGFEVVGGVFGGFLNTVLTLVLFAAMITLIQYLRKQWEQGRQGIVLVACVVTTAFFGFIGFSWLGNLTLGSLGSLFLLLFVVVQTWFITIPYRRLVKQLEKKISAQLATTDNATETSDIHA